MKNNDELDTKAMEFISKYKELTDDKKLSFIKEVDNDLLIHILDPRSINQTDSDDLKEDILKYIFQDESKAKEIVNSIDDTRQLMNLVERFAKNITGTIKKICSLPTEKEQEGSMIQLIQGFSALLNAIELSDKKKLIEMSYIEQLTNTIKQTGKLKMVVEVFIKEIIEGIDKIIANEKEESMKQLENRIRTLLYEIFANVLSKSNSRHKQMIVLKAIADSIRMIKEYRESVDEVFAKILEKIDIAMPNNTEAVKKTFIAIVYMYSSNGYAIDTTDKILEKIDDKKLKSVLKSVLEQEKNQIYEKIEKVSISDNMSAESAAKTLINDMDYITAAIALVNMKCSCAAKILKHIISYPRGNFYNAVLLSCMSAWNAAKILECMKDVNNKFDINSAAKILECMKDANNAAKILGCMKDANNKFDINSVAEILKCMSAWNAAEILECMKDANNAAKILGCMKDVNNKFDSNSVAKILQRMKDANNAAQILVCMEDADNKFDINSAAKILECMGVWNAAQILVCMEEDNAAQILVCMEDDDVCDTIKKCMNDIRLAKEQLEESKDDTKSNPKGKKIKLEISMIFVAVLLIVIEAVITVLSIKSSLKNGYVMNNRMVINKIITAASTMLMMISVIIYVMSKNRSVLYDIIMIGCNALLMVMRICTVFMSNYVNVISIVMIGISVVMIIASLVMIIDPKINKGKNNESKKSGEKNGNGKGIMTKNVILIGFTCVMILSGWIAQVMGMNKNNETSNEIMQE
ncbi:hypothetical protein OCOL_001470 [Ordospora colligata]